MVVALNEKFLRNVAGNSFGAISAAEENFGPSPKTDEMIVPRRDVAGIIHACFKKMEPRGTIMIVLHVVPHESIGASRERPRSSRWNAASRA